MFNSNSSCIFMHNYSNNAGANCSGYIDLKSIKKGFMGIDYVFYSLWDYEKPVEAMANEKTFYVVKVDKDNPFAVPIVTASSAVASFARVSAPVEAR